MQLVVWALLCFVAAALLHKKPIAIIAISLALCVGVPSVAGSFFTGTGSSLTPASWFLLFGLILLLLTRPRDLVRELGSHPQMYFTLVFVFVFALITTASQRPSSSILFTVNTLGFAIALLLVIRTTIDGSPDRARSISLVVVWIACAEAVLAVAQWTTGSSLLWESYLTDYWWYSTTATRVMGTAGSWLDLGVLLAVAVPLTATIRTVALRLLSVALLVVGILLSQGRIPLIAAIIGIVYVIVRSEMRTAARAVSAAAIAIGAWSVLQTDLVLGIAGRDFAGDRSVEARSIALDYAMSQIPSLSWFGGGMGSSYEARTSGAIISSLENSYLMYAWDIGVPVTLLLVVTIIGVIVTTARRGALIRGALPAAIACAALMAAYSGFATSGPGAWLLFTTLGLCAPRPACSPPRASFSRPSTPEVQAMTRC